MDELTTQPFSTAFRSIALDLIGLCSITPPPPPSSSSASQQQIRVESFVSRDILDKTMGSNVPVLRHLAEEAAQQKSRHLALVYGECEW